MWITGSPFAFRELGNYIDIEKQGNWREKFVRVSELISRCLAVLAVQVF